jgi:HEAT repeat protein
MKDVSDVETKNRVRTNVHAVRLLGEYFHQIQHICLLTALFILMFPEMAAACGPISWVEFSSGIVGFPFFIEAVFFWLFAAKFFNCRINFWWILLVTFFANVAATFGSVVITFNVLYRIHAENLLIIGLTFVITVLIEWCVYLLLFHRKIPGFTRLLKISFGANVISYILIAVAYVIYLANPPSYTYNSSVQTDLQNVMASQASYFSEHSTYTASIEELIAEEDLTLNKDVIVQVVYADNEDFKAVAYHKKGNTGYKVTGPAGNFDRIPTKDAVELIEAAVERKKAIAAGSEDDEPIDENWDIRIQNAIRSGNVTENSPEVDFLIEALSDDRAWVRKDAVRFLGAINASRSLKPLIDAMKNDTDYDVRYAAQQVLGKMKDTGAIELLIETLKNEELDADTRYAAAWALSETKHPDAVVPLIDALSYPEQRLQHIAAYSLETMGDPKAVDPLIAILKDENSNLQSEAARALGKLKDPQAVEPLIAALKDLKWWVRKSAASALTEIPDPRAIDPLIATLSDWHASVRHSAATTLGRMIDSHSLEPLVAATQDDRWWVRQAAIMAIGMSESPDAVDVLVDALNDVRPEVRRNAVRALGKIEDFETVDVLIDALSDEDSYVRGESALALGKMGDHRAVGALIAIIDDKAPNVQHSVINALNKITGTPHYHRRDRAQWVKWWEQNQSSYRSENNDTVKEKETNTADTKTGPQKERKKKETVSIVGTWTLRVSGTDCVESITFSSDNIFKIVSGQEIQKGLYTYQKTVRSGKRHKLETIFKYDNGLPDCSGREDKIINEKITRYLEFDYDGSAFTLFPKPSGSRTLVGLYKKIK